MTDCGRWLIVTPTKECKYNLVYFTKISDVDIQGKLPLTPVITKFERDYDYIANFGTKAIFRTNRDAPNFKLMTIDLENYKENSWEELIPEHPQHVLDWADVVDGNKLILCYMEDVKVIIFFFVIEISNLLTQFF